MEWLRKSSCPHCAAAFAANEPNAVLRQVPWWRPTLSAVDYFRCPHCRTVLEPLPIRRTPLHLLLLLFCIACLVASVLGLAGNLPREVTPLANVAVAGILLLRVFMRPPQWKVKG